MNKYWNLATMSAAVLAVAGLVALAFLLSSPFPQTALAQGPCVAGPHGGTISSDQSWCLADSPHIVTGDVIVSEGVTLTVEPGVTVKFYQSGSDADLIINGTLDARGTETLPVRFTSNYATPAKGDWGQIYFGDYSTNSVLDYVTVEYGGRTGIGFEPMIYASSSSLEIDHSTVRRSSSNGIHLNDASPTIRNTTFTDNEGSALLLGGGSCFPDLSGLSAAGNTYNAVSIEGSTIIANYTWGNVGIPEYRISDDVTVNQGVTLTIAAGTTIKLTSDETDILVYGTLNAQGTSTDTIRFTSGLATPAKGDWKQLYFGVSSVGNILEHVTIEYGGGFFSEPSVSIATDSLVINQANIQHGNGVGIQVNDASPTIRNTTFADNESSALLLDGGSCFPTLSDLSATDNGYDAISINGSTYTVNYTWGGIGIPTYRILDDIVVNQGVTLTVEPGTTVKSRLGSTAIRIVVQGTLLAQGTYTKTILFTSDSAAPSKGDWGHIHFEQTSVGSVLEYVTLEYGGGFLIDENVLAETDSLVVRHSAIVRSDADGIRLDGGAPTIEYNSIVENNGYGVNNRDSSITAYARCNWWGHASGPTHASNPSGQGQAVSDGVVFFYWLTSEGGECSFYQVFSPLVVR